MNIDRLKKIGDAFDYKNFLIFFGGKSAPLDAMTAFIPRSHILKQVHGDKLVQCGPGNPEADAQWTNDKNHALLIKTADCLPIMIASPQKGIALAIHSGWRGVEKKITSKSITELRLQDDKELKVFIGPHIQKDSFQVDKDVADTILSSHGLALNSSKVIYEKDSKFHIDLSYLVLQELDSLGINGDRVILSNRDTKAEEGYYSYRRGEKGVSNYSFIVRLK